jgi:hypothetical protein
MVLLLLSVLSVCLVVERGVLKSADIIVVLSVSPSILSFASHIWQFFCLDVSFRIAMSSWWIGPFILYSVLCVVTFYILKLSLSHISITIPAFF